MLQRCNCLILAMLLQFSAYASDTQNLITSVLDSFHQAASDADQKQYFDLLTDNAVFIGTDASERWDKKAFKAFAKPYFDKGQGWTYVPYNRHITLADSGDLAWFDEMLDSQSYGECRGTGVLVLTKNGWKISQYHLTIPVPNALAKDLVQQIKQLSKK
ncbi:nuclear transport factor 2 family protein [uncultured Paraglaciecola sp.]|uniref:nuclear transport factor 2 family protein n=1 Tax=uncultured Paraglaciecola sp. TaxID=1765024 RepID=UPI00261DC14D|nr:nuclear transport factor 2 family protein [uncultured Paraglaciecola sp.]